VKSIRLIFVLLMLLSETGVTAQTEGIEKLYNGKNLTGWNYLPTTEAQKKARAGWQKGDPNAPPWPIVEEKVSFEGKAKSDDGRFVAEGDVLVVAVPAEGRKIQMLYSDAVIEGDFELRLEFRASNNADSGVFIRGQQLQVRDYPNAGPYKKLKKFKTGDWNELAVVVKGETARCTCNGEVLEEKFKVPAKGPIGVEGDRGKIEYRNICIKRNSNNLLKPTSHIDSWTFEQFEDGKGAVVCDGDSIIFDVTNAGAENWHVQTYQSDLKLEEGTEYKVTFEIKADNEDAVAYLQASINEEDWHSVGLMEEIYLGKEFVKYEFTFWASDVHKNDNRVGFAIGNHVAKITLRNFSLVRVDQ